MHVYIIGISGAVGGMVAAELQKRGDHVRGLVRRDDQRRDLATRGIHATVGEMAEMSTADLAADFAGVDVVVFTAGSNGGAREITTAIDGHGVDTVLQAARVAGVPRFALVSVLPESWRDRELGDDVEYYFAVKKQADVAVTRSGLDWLILRPSLLVDDAGTGMVSLGPAEIHDQIARADVAATLAALLHEPGIGRQILELNTGSLPIAEAVRSVAS